MLSPEVFMYCFTQSLVSIKKAQFMSFEVAMPPAFGHDMKVSTAEL
jgi:hypothetical protein